MKLGFCLGQEGSIAVRLDYLLQEQLSFKAMQLRLPPVLSVCLCASQRFGYQRQPLSGLAGFPICLSKQCEIIRQSHLPSCGSKGCQAVAHLGDAFHPLSLLSQHPTLKDRPPGQVVCKPMLDTEYRRCFRPLVDGALLTAKLMEYRRIIQGQRQAKRMRQLAGPFQRGVAHRQRLIRIAKMPQGMGCPGSTKHSQIHAEKERMRTVLLGIVERNTLLQVLASRGKCSQTVQSCP